MNSFVCESSFQDTTSALDMRRLGKQRIECWQMLMALLGQSTAYANHPATRAWSGYEYSLASFAIACHDEWISRGYKDTTRDRVVQLRTLLSNTGDPWWVTNDRYLNTIRGVLIGKMPEYYGPLWPDVEAMYGKQSWPTATYGVFTNPGDK